MMAVALESAQKPLPPKPPSLAGCWLTLASETKADSHRDFVQADILDGGPYNRQAAGLGGEDVNLIGALAHEAPQTFNGIGGLDMPMHPLRKVVKREGFLFFLCQTAHGFWIPLAVFGFEGRQLRESLPFAGLIPDASEFSLNISALSPRDGIQDIALFVQQTALAWCR